MAGKTDSPYPRDMAQRMPHGTILTLAEYEALPDDPLYIDEVSQGRLVREPRPGEQHGRMVTLISYLLMRYVDEHPDVGIVYTESGFVLSERPLGLRGPDVAFVRAERAPKERPRSFFIGPPDLAIEIVSPSNTSAGLQKKVAEFLQAGTLAVWVIDPIHRLVVIHEPARIPRVLHENDEIDGGALLPDLRWDIQSLFPEY